MSQAHETILESGRAARRWPLLLLIGAIMAGLGLLVASRWRAGERELAEAIAETDEDVTPPSPAHDSHPQ